jgi:hypothetical protein
MYNFKTLTSNGLSKPPPRHSWCRQHKQIKS